MGYIYKIINTVNSKVYIGQTTRNIKVRWNEHLRKRFDENSKRYNLHLYKSIRKYGKDAFTIEAIECCDNDLLNDKEVFWIKHYNSADPNCGYNLTLGGNGTKSINYEEVYKRYDSGESAAEIATSMGIGRSHLTQILKGYVNYDREITWERSKQYLSIQKGNPVCQYDLLGNLILSLQ